MAYSPKKLDVVWLDFDPQAGHEQAGKRPAVIISPDAYNKKIGLAIVVPITSKKKGYPFEVDLPDGIGVTGVVLADQVKSIDWKVRNAEKFAEIPQAVFVEIKAKIDALL